jgi:carbon monoxide dehydrogenase subunit G
MGHVESSKQISATPDQVFAVLTDPSRRADWLTIHAGWLEEPPATVEQGAKLVEKIVMLGMANRIEWNVDELVPGSRVVTSGTGMAGVKVRFEFDVEPDGDGSNTTISGDFEGAMIVGAVGKAVEKDAVANIDTSLDKLAALAVG